MSIPATPVLLSTPDATKPGQRGGTLIAETVCDVEEHRRLPPAGERRVPAGGLPLCGRFLHVHDRQRSRTLRDLSGSTTEEFICRFRCRPCHAVWQVLPGFIARHLHRTWETVQTAVADLSAPERMGLQQQSLTSTLCRWQRRLDSSGLVLIQALLGFGTALGAVLKEVGAWCTRAELVDALAHAGLVAKEHRFKELACWIHRTAPGVRLM